MINNAITSALISVTFSMQIWALSVNQMQLADCARPSWQYQAGAVFKGAGLSRGWIISGLVLKDLKASVWS